MILPEVNEDLHGRCFRGYYLRWSEDNRGLHSKRFLWNYRVGIYDSPWNSFADNSLSFFSTMAERENHK